MRSDRIARGLLRLYPRTWRARYGDELLALLADQGLSTRAAIDIVAAAALERTRSLVVLIRNDLDPQTAQLAPVPFREAVREGAWFIGLLATTVGIVTMSGVPLPSWSWWYFTGTIWAIGGAFSTTQPTASASERATLAFFRHAVASAGTGLAWSIAGASRWFGIPNPPDQVVYWSFGVFFGAVACRGIYGGIRSHIDISTWEGIHARELAAWRVGLVAVIMLTAFLDPKADAFWSLEMIMTLSLQLPHHAARHAAARHRRVSGFAEPTWMFKKADRS